jgi:hypothetical protein
VLPVTLDSTFLIFMLSSFSGIVLPVTQISRMEILESHATLCQRKIIKQISRMENPESHATQYQRKKKK